MMVFSYAHAILPHQIISQKPRMHLSMIVIFHKNNYCDGAIIDHRYHAHIFVLEEKYWEPKIH